MWFLSITSFWKAPQRIFRHCTAFVGHSHVTKITSGDIIFALGMKCQVDFVSDQGYHLIDILDQKAFAIISHADICHFENEEVNRRNKLQSEAEIKYIESLVDAAELGVENEWSLLDNIRNEKVEIPSDVFEEVPCVHINQSSGPVDRA